MPMTTIGESRKPYTKSCAMMINLPASIRFWCQSTYKYPIGRYEFTKRAEHPISKDLDALRNPIERMYTRR
jgi:hypothetical protein